MTAEGNKAVVRQLFEEVINPGDLGRARPGRLQAGQYDAPRRVPQSPPNRRGDGVRGGHRVSVRFTARGTHQGEFWGVPPTGSRVAWEVISIVRVAGGKIAERWSQSDVAGLRRQLDDG